MGKLIHKIILFGYFFMMIYKPEFKIFYPTVNTFFGIIGFAFYIFNMDKRQLEINRRGHSIKKILKTYIPVLLFSIFTIMVNMSMDFYYVRYFVSIILYFFMAYLWAWGTYKVYGQITPPILINFFIIAAFLHLGVSLARYASPSIDALVKSLLRLSEADQLGLEHTMGARLQGFGASFFTSGIINGFVLIMIAVTMYCEKLSSLQKILYSISYVVIFVIGIMNARTIMIGGGLGAILLFFALFKEGTKVFAKNIILLGCATALLAMGATMFVSKSSIDFETLSDFGFEMFRAFGSGGDGSTHSTDSMLAMYSKLPDNPKTWIIGDARWTGSLGWNYYGGSDIGFARNLFYFGIIGSLLLYSYNFKILKTSLRKKNIFGKITSKIVLLLFLYTMILNLKGPADLFFYVLPYYFCGISKTNKLKLL